MYLFFHLFLHSKSGCEVAGLQVAWDVDVLIEVVGVVVAGDARRAVFKAIKTKKNLHSAYTDRSPTTKIRQGARKFLNKMVAGARFALSRQSVSGFD